VSQTLLARVLSGKHQNSKVLESATRGQILSSVGVSEILFGICIQNLDLVGVHQQQQDLLVETMDVSMEYNPTQETSPTLTTILDSAPPTTTSRLSLLAGQVTKHWREQLT